MSVTPSPSDSPVHIESLHNPSQAAHIVVPQAPLGNAPNGFLNMAPGMGAKALLAKKMAKNSNPKFISPTDNLMTPCTQKISAAKKKHFNKPPKPMQQLAFEHNDLPEEEDTQPEDVLTPSETSSTETDQSDEMKVDDEENPF